MVDIRRTKVTIYSIDLTQDEINELALLLSTINDTTIIKLAETPTARKSMLAIAQKLFHEIELTLFNKLNNLKEEIMNIDKRIPPKHIKLIENHLPCDRPVIFKEISLEDWEKQGRPYVIELVEKYGNAYFYRDTGYGFMILIVDDKIAGDKLARGREICAIGNVIALNKDYFDLDSYIFKGNPKK